MSKRWPLLVAPAALLACASAAPPVTPLRVPARSVPRPAEAPPTARLAVPPSACTAAPPATIDRIANGSTALAAVATRGVLWVMELGAPDPRGRAVASLLEVRGASSDHPTLADTARIGEANVDGGVALAAWDGRVVGAFGGAGSVTVFRREPSGDVRTSSIAAPASAPNVSVAVVGDRALVTWDDSEGGVEYAWVDLASMEPGAKMRLDGSYAEPAATPSFGGWIALTESSAQAGGIRGLAPGDAAPIQLPAVGSDNGSGAAATGTANRAFVVYDAVVGARAGELIPAGTTKLATLTDAHGAGVAVELGASGAVPESAIALAPWGGAIAAYANDKGGVDVAAVTAEGGAIGRAFTASAADEPARSPAIASDETGAYVVWNQPESLELRMAPIACR